MGRNGTRKDVARATAAPQASFPQKAAGKSGWHAPDAPRVLGGHSAVETRRRGRHIAGMTAKSNDQVEPQSQQPPKNPADPPGSSPPRPREIGGPKGPEPTRYGDWEVNGRCTDF